MKRKILTSQVLDRAYEIINDDVRTYLVIKSKDNTISIIEHQHFYLQILGDKLIQKLEGKGYLPLKEIEQKYEITIMRKKDKIKQKKKSTNL